MLKMKNGKKVPNCVPVKEEDLKEYILKSKREILVYNKGY